MIALLLAAALSVSVSSPASVAPPPASAAPAPDEDPIVANLFLPHPDVLRGKLKGSPLQGFAPWFATSAATRWPWLVRWDADAIFRVPQALSGAHAQSDSWVRDPSVASLLSKPADMMATADLTYFRFDKGTPQVDVQTMRRLGVNAVHSAQGYATVGDDHALHGQVTLQLASDNRGLFDTLGPAAPSVHPANVPHKAEHWSAARVVPAKVWELLESVGALRQPIQYGLARAQLDLLEDSLKTRWREDVLGYEPRTWAFYTLPNGEAVATLDIKKGASAAAFVRQTLITVRDIAKNFTFQETKTSAATMWSLGGDSSTRYIAVAGDTLVFANTQEALTNHLAYRGSVAPMRDAGTSPAPAVAWGSHDNAHLIKRLANFNDVASFRAASKSVGAAPLAPKDALKNLGRHEWWMDTIPEGFGVTVLVHPASANANN